MRWLRLLLHAWAWMLIAFHSTVATGSRLTPPVLPLIVRNPYLSTWLGNARDAPWSKWPMFYTGEEIGLSLMAHVPSTGKTYPLLGRPHDSLETKNPDAGYSIAFPVYKGASYDASTTNLSYIIYPRPRDVDFDPLEITISFLSPITPPSTLRQSIPASYVTVYVKGNMNVNIYMDMNGQWVSGDRGAAIKWEYNRIVPEEGKHGLQRWEVTRQIEQLFTEIRDRAEWGTLHFVAPMGVRYESGTSGDVRPRFARTGTVQNVNDGGFRTIMDREPIFAFAKSFVLNETSTWRLSNVVEDSVTFTIAHIQDPVVQFASARGLTFMRPLWKSWFTDVDNLLSFHYFDFPNARTIAARYSADLAADAHLSGAEDYVDIVALSARQVLGATSFSGTSENPILFLKEISSNGNAQTIDVIFPSSPFFIYTNPRWLAYLLEPLIEHMLSGQYPNTYAMHDLGKHFPNITGHPDGKDEYMPVEECGNMLIMGLSLVNALIFLPGSNKTPPWLPSTELGRPDSDQSELGIFPLMDFRTISGIDRLDSTWKVGPKATKEARRWVERSYRLWKQWTGYLVEFSLEPENQLSTDDFAGWLALQTNLALKGIVGINAMSKLAKFVGHDEEALYYKNISNTYISRWEELGTSRDKTHAKLSYDWYGSWTTLYNMYGDALLCFHLENTDDEVMLPYEDQELLRNPTEKKIGFVPRHIYTRQSNWYHYVRQKYGLPLDSRHLYTKTDWEFFAMAVSSRYVRHEILQSVARWVNETSTDRPFTDLHETEGDGGWPGPRFMARPVVGGHFAFVALQNACNGKAMDGLKFLDDDKPDGDPGDVDCEGELECLDPAPAIDSNREFEDFVEDDSYRHFQQQHDGSQVKMGLDANV
ncbi:hypothetical protein VTO42DRAFT_8957 [Malbranchea cinnamomea]